MSEFKITERGWYRTRDGSKVEVVHVGPEYASVADADGGCHSVSLNGRSLPIDRETAYDIVSRWIEPAVGSREWAMALPGETKVWNKGWPVQANVSASKANYPPDGWFIVGSAEWANALPVGTKVRCHLWRENEYVTKTEEGWNRSHHGLTLPSHRVNDKTGWLLYTPPTPQPWSRPEDVPVDAIIRGIGRTGEWGRILGVRDVGIAATSSSDADPMNVCVRRFTWDDLKHCEHSTDGGKTWKPCVKEVL